MTTHPYREAPEADFNESPPCMHKVSDETKIAYAAVGGWWHGDDCIAWHRRLWSMNPADPRLAEFFRTCSAPLRKTFE